MNVVLIAGPTASGKSSAAIGIAKKHNGVIINADSMQVYSVLDVLTSRPSRQDEADVEHLLYGYISPQERCSVARWLKDIENALEQVTSQGRLAIIVGGTGLYFKALEFGLAPVPEISPQIRKEVRARLADVGPVSLHAELAQLDEEGAANLEQNDGQRIARALEVVKSTGRSLAYYTARAQQESILAKFDPVKRIIMPRRELLYSRINERFVEMVDEGALEEVKQLYALNLAADLPAMKAIGVRALGEYLNGALDLETAIEIASQETRNYAKRQMTWFRNQMAHWRNVTAGAEINIR